MLLSHNHGSVENHPKRKATFILEIHPSAFYVYIFFFSGEFWHTVTQFTWKKDAGIPEPRKKKTYCFPLNPGWFMRILLLVDENNPYKTWFLLISSPKPIPQTTVFGPFFQDAQFRINQYIRSPNFQPRKKLLQVMRWCQRLDREGFSGCWEAEEKYHGIRWSIGFRGKFCGNFSWMNKIKTWVELTFPCSASIESHKIRSQIQSTSAIWKWQVPISG